MKGTKHLFSFQKLNRYYIMPFLVPLICFSTKFFSTPLKDNDGEVKLPDITPDNEHTFVFLYQMINSTSLIFGGFLCFVSYIETKTKREKTRKSTMERGMLDELNLANDKVGYKKRKWRTIIIISLMSIIITVYNIIKGYATKHKLLEKRLYFLFFFLLINRLFYKKHIFSHQKFAIGIAFIGMALIFAMFFVYLDGTYDYIYDIVLLIGSFFYSLYLVLVKDLTVNNSMSPFFLLFIIGIASTCLTLVGYTFLSLSNKNDMTYISNIFNCTEQNYVCFGNFAGFIFAYFFINFVLQVLIFLVVYFFSPEVFAISDIISPFLSFIVGLFKDATSDKVSFYIFTGLGYLIIIFGSFLYNEIIICNFWGLDENTKHNIDSKAARDIEGYEKDDSNLISDDLIVQLTNLEEVDNNNNNDDDSSSDNNSNPNHNNNRYNTN